MGEPKMNGHVGSKFVGNSTENNLGISGCSTAVSIRDTLCARKHQFKLLPVREGGFNGLFPDFQCYMHNSRCFICFQNGAFQLLISYTV